MSQVTSNGWQKCAGSFPNLNFYKWAKWTRTIVFIVIGVYLGHFHELGPILKCKNVLRFPDTEGIRNSPFVWN